MKADDLRIEELIQVSDGMVSLHGRRLIIHDMYAMTQLRRDLIVMVGLEQVRRIFTRLGYFWGQADASAMKRICHWDDLSELLKASYKLLSLQGVRVAKFDTSVLITGPTGTGKEVLARHIHKLSPRGKGPFIAVNCTTLTETLLESELFGHKAGSFTGAMKDKSGLFEEAKAGTIFLDEIGDITPAMQLKLLRVLQEREVKRVGETRPRKLDVRIIAATNRELDQMVADETFREDLYYRLQVVRIAVPPLCERCDDILPLARQFLKKCSDKLGLPNLQLSATCVDFLLDYQLCNLYQNLFLEYPHKY